MTYASFTSEQIPAGRNRGILHAHIAFTAAFTQLNLDTAYLVIAFVCTSVAGSLVLKWLWKYLHKVPYRLAIPALSFG